ncbi:hypothetical protein ACFQ1I_04830 [Kitasatospora arboriphila]
MPFAGSTSGCSSRTPYGEYSVPLRESSPCHSSLPVSPSRSVLPCIETRTVCGCPSSSSVPSTASARPAASSSRRSAGTQSSTGLLQSERPVRASRHSTKKWFSALVSAPAGVTARETT